MVTPHEQHGAAGPHDPTGALVKQASEQLSELVRAEMRLARAEMADKGRQFGIGGGLLGGAGLVGVLALQALVATAVVALALLLPLWAAALVVTAVLALTAFVLARLGKGRIDRATPPAPDQTLDSLKADAAEIKERAHR
ncbi:phage holin family protein [Streptomyces sp. NPDC087917]|uniref:phage holin family protein n=1 Tax=Streptomyces sp. NPDC087917 TaxID=3155060 RepID=UPI00344A75B5